MKNKRTNENFTVNCRRVSQNSFTGEFDISITQSSGLSVQNGDTIECLHNYNGANYTNYSVYDTCGSVFDNTPPAPITDLEAISGGLNTVKLQWTSTGDDGFEGEAFKYDIRYSFRQSAVKVCL
ncbi:MAG: hypothetical protein IPL53_03985 [Ignavibacteria bacterium]|nr:hypothetical protein [Ignavibacteria bacterium]